MALTNTDAYLLRLPLFYLMLACPDLYLDLLSYCVSVKTCSSTLSYYYSALLTAATVALLPVVMMLERPA